MGPGPLSRSCGPLDIFPRMPFSLPAGREIRRILAMDYSLSQRIDDPVPGNALSNEKAGAAATQSRGCPLTNLIGTTCRIGGRERVTPR